MTAKSKNRKDPVRILLVDDEEGFVQVLAKRMAKRNFHVMTAYNGAEAIQILRGNDFDIAIIDFKMEELDGIEVLKVFKMMTPNLPVIILTGHGCETAAAEADTPAAAAAPLARKPRLVTFGPWGGAALALFVVSCSGPSIGQYSSSAA